MPLKIGKSQKVISKNIHTIRKNIENRYVMWQGDIKVCITAESEHFGLLSADTMKIDWEDLNTLKTYRTKVEREAKKKIALVLLEALLNMRHGEDLENTKSKGARDDYALKIRSNMKKRL